MNAPINQGTPTRPYLLRALHEWCTDNGFTPYVAVHVDASVQVPTEYVKNHEIVLNVGFEATTGLKLGNHFIEFKARFGGVAREIVVPVDHVVAIYARENGQGMAFPMPQSETSTPSDPTGAARGLRLASTEVQGPALSVQPTPTASADLSFPEGPPPGGPARPSLKRIK